MRISRKTKVQPPDEQSPRKFTTYLRIYTFFVEQKEKKPWAQIFFSNKRRHTFNGNDIDIDFHSSSPETQERKKCRGRSATSIVARRRYYYYVSRARQAVLQGYTSPSGAPVREVFKWKRSGPGSIHGSTCGGVVVAYVYIHVHSISGGKSVELTSVITGGSYTVKNTR